MNGRRRELSTASESCFILAMCLGLPIVTSLSAMVRSTETTTYPLTDRSLINLMIIEMLSLLAVALILHTKGWRKEDFGIRFSLKQCGAGLLLFAVSYIMFILLCLAVTTLFRMPEGWGTVPLKAEFSLTVAVLFCALNALFEEFVTVGYVLNSMRHHGRVFAVSLSMFLRFLYHTYQGPIAVVAIMPMGLLFAGVYWRFNWLWPLVFAHFIWDVLAFLAMDFSS